MPDERLVKAMASITRLQPTWSVVSSSDRGGTVLGVTTEFAVELSCGKEESKLGSSTWASIEVKERALQSGRVIYGGIFDTRKRESDSDSVSHLTKYIAGVLSECEGATKMKEAGSNRRFWGE